MPGGGVEDGETKEIALRREMLEETGIDINQATVNPIRESWGEHEKTLRDTGERVYVKMDFFNYRIDLNQNADDVILKAEDDWCEPRWFEIDELKDTNLSEPTLDALVFAGVVTGN